MVKEVYVTDVSLDEAELAPIAAFLLPLIHYFLYSTIEVAGTPK